ncbi:Serine/threonine-protein phosphatase 7 long form [Glycine max]|nr:Serine/threonine-protein phosphatase 7 long form [Glycine max]
MATLLCKSHVACKPPLVLAIQVQCKSPVSLASPSLLWETASLTSGSRCFHPSFFFTALHCFLLVLPLFFASSEPYYFSVATFVLLVKFLFLFGLHFLVEILMSFRWLRRGNQHIGNDDLIVFRRKLDIMKRHEFLWEPYTATVLSMLPPICLVGTVAWCAVMPLICFHVVEWHQPDRVLRQFGMQQPIPEPPLQPQSIHGLTLKGKMDENWFQLLAPFISQWHNRAEFKVDVYPRQEGLLSFNSDYMVWYRRKTKMFVDQNNAKTATLGEVAETLQYMVSPQGRNTWTVDDLVPYVEKLTILSEEQERITEPVAHGPTSERRFPPQQFDMLPSSVETRGFDRRREIQHDAPMATPNAPLAPQWNVPGAIPDMGDLLGVDLRHEFSAEAEQQGRRQRARRNPDREARRWDRSCGTGSRHHGHHND